MDISSNENNVNDLNINDSDINVIMRQTTYTREEAYSLFSQLGTVEKCIHHYLGIKPREEPHLSTNQKIFKSIRDFI